MTVEFELVTDIAAPVEVVFDLSTSIDLHLASMSDSRERAVRGTTSGQIRLGETVTWKARHFGLPFTMTSAITAWERPGRFVDEQVHGPFRRFRHEHRFEGVEGRTVVVDLVRFDAPGWMIGRAAEQLFLGAYLSRLIGERNEYLTAAAERVGR